MDELDGKSEAHGVREATVEDGDRELGDMLVTAMRGLYMHYIVNDEVAVCGGGSRACGIGPMAELEASANMPSKVRGDVEAYLEEVRADWEETMARFAEQVSEITGEEGLHVMQEFTPDGPRLMFGRREDGHGHGHGHEHSRGAGHDHGRGKGHER